MVKSSWVSGATIRYPTSYRCIAPLRCEGEAADHVIEIELSVTLVMVTLGGGATVGEKQQHGLSLSVYGN